MSELRIELPLPPRETHPNARPHWAAKSRAAKKQRADACLAAHAAMAELRILPPRWESCTIHATFYRPQSNDRTSDGLNLIAWLKASEDGCQDAGVFVNDRGNIWIAPTEITGKKANGERKVVLTIRPTAATA